MSSAVQMHAMILMICATALTIAVMETAYLALFMSLMAMPLDRQKIVATFLVSFKAWKDPDIQKY